MKPITRKTEFITHPAPKQTNNKAKETPAPLPRFSFSVNVPGVHPGIQAKISGIIFTTSLLYTLANLSTGSVISTSKYLAHLLSIATDATVFQTATMAHLE